MMEHIYLDYQEKYEVKNTIFLIFLSILINIIVSRIKRIQLDKINKISFIICFE